MNCNCGCNSEAIWIVKSFDFDPGKLDHIGKPFEEPACENSMLYLIESAQELGFPATVERI